MKLTRKAHAKLNLFLEVTGKRANGYHELFSLVVFLDLADEITVSPADEITVMQTNGDAGITDNIIYKAAHKLQKKYKILKGARISFTKNIPIGGGLGGGSSDAAVTLVLLNNLWKLNLSHDDLYEIGLELGADVPVCLYSILKNKSAAIFKGIGEEIFPAPELPKMFFTLVNPGIELHTKDVFANFKYEGLGYEPFPKRGDAIKNICKRSNDLEPTAIALLPEIGEALDELAKSKNCKLARMTGSGATSFGLYKKRLDARDAAVDLIKKHPDWQIGPVGVKKISAYGTLERLKRPFLRKRVRTVKSIRDSLRNSATLNAMGRILRKLHIKTFMAQNFGLSTTFHLIILVLLTGFFVFQKYSPPTEYITVSFGVENPAMSPVVENDLEPASGESEDADDVEEVKPPTPAPAPVKKAAPKPKPAKKAADTHKSPKKQLGAKPGILGAKNGNTSKPAKPAATDYLELLQYTVQQRSEVPNNDPSLKGRAILHLAFNRRGYVLAYNLKQKTGSPVLDKAAEKVAKKLMDNPFPPVPDDFDTGDEILEYDFVISYPHSKG